MSTHRVPLVNLVHILELNRVRVDLLTIIQCPISEFISARTFSGCYLCCRVFINVIWICGKDMESSLGMYQSGSCLIVDIVMLYLALGQGEHANI